jgi:hypothetical protein
LLHPRVYNGEEIAMRLGLPTFAAAVLCAGVATADTLTISRPASDLSPGMDRTYEGAMTAYIPEFCEFRIYDQDYPDDTGNTIIFRAGVDPTEECYWGGEAPVGVQTFAADGTCSQSASVGQLHVRLDCEPCPAGNPISSCW